MRSVIEPQGDSKGKPKQMSISVVICALNEAANLPHVLNRLPSNVSEVILVDGHSMDGTVDKAREILPSIRVLYQPGKGKGDALNFGFDNATSDLIIALDADGSTDPEEMDRFIHPLIHGYDVCKGSRFLKGAGTDDMPRHRILGNRLFTLLTNFLFRAEFTDLAYGYFGCRRECWPQMKPRTNGFAVETEIQVKAKKAGLKIIEVPSWEHRRISGKGNLRSFRDGRKILWTILRERFTMWSRARP